jgi:hypothetical protein
MDRQAADEALKHAPFNFGFPLGTPAATYAFSSASSLSWARVSSFGRVTTTFSAEVVSHECREAVEVVLGARLIEI